MKTIPLKYGKFFHIYNRGINGCNLFHENENYEHFLYLYDKHVAKVADTFAWVLMKNHFHFLVRIKNEEQIPFMSQTPEGLKDSLGSGENLSAISSPESVLKKYKPASQFSHLFNAYAKAINNRFHRTGSLFEHPFQRVEVKSREQLLYLIYYIHHNPIHHGFCNHFLEYPWSSYLTMLSPKQTKLKRDEVLNWFQDKAYFKEYHSKEQIKKFEELKIDYLGDC
jgi:putative transposase